MADSSKTGAQLLASYMMSLAIFALAAAIIYFAYEMSRVSTQIPDILSSVDHTSEKVGPIVSEVGEIRELIPDILHEVGEIRELVPPILSEVEQTRLHIPPILEEVAQTRAQIPPILKEVEAVRKEIPAVLKSTDKASDAVVAMSREIEAARPLVPEMMKEVETTRESIPPMLDRMDAMIQQARTAGQEASSGAVTGFFKGLITTPFKLVGDAGRTISGLSNEEMKKFTPQDFNLIEATAIDVLNNGKKGEVRKMNNPDSGFTGTVKLVSIESRDEDFTMVDCRTLQMEAHKDGERIKTVNRTFCHEEGSGWDIDE